MSRTTLRAGWAAAVTTVLLGAAAVAAPTADAATAVHYYGYAGSGYIRVGDATVTSNLTVQSTASSNGADVSDPKRTAHVVVSGIADVGAVTTNSTVAATSSGQRAVTSAAKVADVSLLGGLIKAQAITSTSTTSTGASSYSATSKGTFLGLSISKTTLPAVIPQNFGLTLPGVATVLLNFSRGYAIAGAGQAYGAGVLITLLKAIGKYKAGAVIMVAPSYAAAQQTSSAPSTGHAVAGYAYGTKISAHATSAVTITSDATASTQLYSQGTAGATQSAAVAAVDVAPALTVGAVQTTGKGTNTTSGASAAMTSKVATINLLGGLIKADAITATASAATSAGGTALTGGSKLVDLVINGQDVPVDAAPNSSFDIAGIATVTVNEQTTSKYGILVRGLDVTLTTAKYGLDVGAQIEVAVAYAAAA